MCSPVVCSSVILCARRHTWTTDGSHLACLCANAQAYQGDRTQARGDTDYRSDNQLRAPMLNARAPHAVSCRVTITVPFSPATCLLPTNPKKLPVQRLHPQIGCNFWLPPVAVVKQLLLVVQKLLRSQVHTALPRQKRASPAADQQADMDTWHKPAGRHE